VSALLFACAIPHTYLLYPIIWSDPCSDTFFWAFEASMTWIAGLNAMEGAAGVSLGYIDYRSKHGNTEELNLAMRKKRMAFAKFAFIMAVVAMFMLDQPTPNCVFPLIMASGWTTLKMGT